MVKRKNDFDFLQGGGKNKAIETAEYADLKQMNERGQSLMFAAAGRPRNKGSAELLCQILQKRGLAVDAWDNHHQTPLFAAAREGNETCADWLIAQGCRVDHSDLKGETPLCIAFENSHMDMVMKLLKHGASLGVKDMYGGRQPQFFANPIFRRAFMEKRAAPPETTSSPKKRKRGQAEEQPLWKRFRGDLSMRCTGPHVMTQWAYQEEIVPEETVPDEKVKEVLAENDDFMIIVPPPEATARIRVLEREFALDHADCLRGHPMHLAMAPADWANFAGIPVNEADGHKKIFSLLKKCSDKESLICCVQKSTGCIRGYLHLSLSNEHTLYLAHLKVQRAFQRQGIASLLLEGGICFAQNRRGWHCNEISLMVAWRNTRAIAFYESMGFTHCDRSRKRQRSVLEWRPEWSCMKKILIPLLS